MTYERQRKTANKLVGKYGTTGLLVQTEKVVTDVAWRAVTTTTTKDIKFVAFADDGVTFVNHNIMGDVRLLTVVGTDGLINIRVGDKIKTAAREFNVELAKPLDPDLTGAILWAALVK